MLAIGFLGFCFYVFAYHSRLLDFGLGGLHLPGIALGLAIGAAVLSGRVAQGLKNRIGFFMAGFSVWLVLSIPGSYWRRGSIGVLAGVWIPAMVLFLVGGSVIATVAQCRRALYVLGLATAIAAMIVTWWGDASLGRLGLAGTNYANANTVAIMLLLGMPMVWLLASGAQAGNVRKALVGGVLVMMVVALLRTASRGGMVGLAVLCVTGFARSRALGKLAIAFAVIVLALTSALFLPHSLQARLGTILGPESEEIEGPEETSEWAGKVSAAESSQARLRVLKESLEVTASHPLLGVGPGNFAPYCADREKEKARPRYALWVGTHNSYTQVSSELGIPGLIFFLGILVASMRALQKIYRRARRIPGNQGSDIAYMALALHTSFVVLCVTYFFNHMAYEPTMPLMAAITVAMSRTAPDELRRMEEAARVSNGGEDPHVPRANQSSLRTSARLEKAR